MGNSRLKTAAMSCLSLVLALITGCAADDDSLPLELHVVEELRPALELVLASRGYGIHVSNGKYLIRYKVDDRIKFGAVLASDVLSRAGRYEDEVEFVYDGSIWICCDLGDNLLGFMHLVYGDSVFDKISLSLGLVLNELGLQEKCPECAFEIQESNGEFKIIVNGALQPSLERVLRTFFSGVNDRAFIQLFSDKFTQFYDDPDWAAEYISNHLEFVTRG